MADPLSDHISQSEMVEVLKQRVAKRGEMTELARRLDVTIGFLSSLVHGRQPISTSVGRELGFERVVMWRKIR